jgi:hypothetical protein
MANDLNESAVLNTEPDNAEWEQQQRVEVEAEYEQGIREADAERRYEESLIEASEPGAAQEMADFRAREEATNQGASLPFQNAKIQSEPWVTKGPELETRVVTREQDGQYQYRNETYVSAGDGDMGVGSYQVWSEKQFASRDEALLEAQKNTRGVDEFDYEMERLYEGRMQALGTFSDNRLIEEVLENIEDMERDGWDTMEQLRQQGLSQAQIDDGWKGFIGKDSERSDANSLSPSATEDIWGEPRNNEITSDEKGLLTPDDLDRIPWHNQNSPEKDQAVKADATVAEQLQQETNEAVQKTTKEGAPLRFETSTRTAEYQPGTNTVDFTNKTTSSKTELVPGEGISGSPETAEAVRSRTEEVFGAKIDRDEFDNSDQPLEIADRAADTRERGLENAKTLASHELKTNAQVTLADKNDGIYNGKILGVTDSYLLQRSGPASAVAHDKGMFENLPSYGRDATILYSAGNARVSLQPTKDKGLRIER